MSKFQLILLTVFGFFIIVAVMVFAIYRGAGSVQATVTVWGSIANNDFDTFLNNAGFSQDKTLTISYVEKSVESLEADFTEALAAGSGPDIIILSQDKFWKNKNKLIAIPYSSLGEKDFKDTFVQAGEVFLTAEGIYALPISIDPMVLYYNRDLLSTAGIAKPLSFWDEIYKQTLNLSKRDAAGNLIKSAVAMGETKNIDHFKDILSLLFLQAGTPITAIVGSELRSTLTDNFNLPINPAGSALDFYAEFANPTKTYHSWNRTMPEAQTRFTSGDLAYYLGFASEVTALRGKSPTLNFSVASVPQSRVAGRAITFAHIEGMAISRGSKNPTAAFLAVSKIILPENASLLSQILGLPPVRRDLLGVRPTDSIFPVFYDAALQSKVWLDPDDEGTDQIFRDMIDTITSGRARTSEIVNKASEKLDNLINK
ncbi:MAG: extracellular solute-binding protein [Candidatus Zambryskibacteria bacterium]|nr:extracellular solute-binding protein [Candidatus Zambryskibacteria bacterium]